MVEALLLLIGEARVHDVSRRRGDAAQESGQERPSGLIAAAVVVRERMVVVLVVVVMVAVVVHFAAVRHGTRLLSCGSSSPSLLTRR